jgi:hypothetical protein
VPLRLEPLVEPELEPSQRGPKQLVQKNGIELWIADLDIKEDKLIAKRKPRPKEVKKKMN